MTCRFCKRYETDAHRYEMFQYAARHHAHWDCWLNAKGKTGLLALPDWALWKFPALLADEHGLLNALDAEQKRRGLAEKYARWSDPEPCNA